MEMEVPNIKILNMQDWKILKSIRLEKCVDNHHVWAILFYTRDVSPNYHTIHKQIKTDKGIFCDVKDYYPQDTLDEKILSAVRVIYPNAKMETKDVKTTSDIDCLRRLYCGYHKEQATVYLMPKHNQIDSMYFPDNARFNRDKIPVDIYVLADSFLPYFHNDEYFCEYEISDTNTIKEILSSNLPTVHHLEDLWRNQHT